MMLVLVACCLTGISSASAAESAPFAADPPLRIGLVLAGGGARGLAHVGVLKYLEEHHIRISAVAGTSMGSIVGGLYASGLNADQIAGIVQTLDWKSAFDDSTTRDQLSFRQKQEDFDFLVRAKLRFKDGKLNIPLGLVQGQHLNLLLHDLVAHVSDVHDFDQLPIPFRAIATDIVSGDPVILAKGDLAVAMRASMSIPAFFAPIELDGKLLVDGGIAKNIPVDVVQAMGVDRLIVIDIGTPLAGRESMANMFSLIGQLTTILTRRNSEEQIALMGPQDILLIPDLDDSGVETMSFDKAELAIQLGYQAATAMGDKLAALSTPGNAMPSAVVSRSAEPPIIQRIEIHQDSQISSELLRNRITQPIGAPLDKAQLERDIAEIYGLDQFSRVEYVVNDVAGEQVLTISAIAIPYSEKYLKLGLSLDQDTKGENSFGIAGSWRQKGINRLGAEWYTKIQIGGDSVLKTQYYQPLDVNQRYFFDTGYSFKRRTVNLSADGDIIARAEIDSHTVDIAPGFYLGDAASVRVGAFAQTADTEFDIGDPRLGSSSANDAGYFAQLLYDTLDRPFFPGSGSRLSAGFQTGKEGWGAQTGYDSLNVFAMHATSWGEHTLAGLLRWQELELDNPGTPLTVATQLSTLGGFLALSGYSRNSLAGNYLGQGALLYYRRMNEQSLLPIDLPVYVGASFEAGNVWLEKDNVAADELIYAGSLFLGVDSPIGPIYLGVGVAENDQRALYLQIGQILD
ncbi:MAG: patatin-like phospholipase family protein [Gammaproteobacteria bacterium]|nr:patatin-like phospholipase family protein [Gammaproteobacteria bacterium]MBP6050897.1 patatin-like phospholipase family protein [Pseudomonadales bacterium]MBK6582404.1 patatin-like phospholipase family protein [Gammaproteobacteria bacterium]MBK7521324.1 patatin-like phospholipase family protein [Gammaproteobacteria bacterium]MBK7729102.1 patatin-like phospholipase family protein [Gammaproteobacteria bacterium]